jgi:anti-sigma factor RsiW
MTHPTEGTLQGYLDDELPRDELAAVARHLAVCSACESELIELREAATTFAGAVAVLDLPVRVPDRAQGVVSGARSAPSAPSALSRAPELVSAPEPPSRAPGTVSRAPGTLSRAAGALSWAPGALLRAAAVVLLLGGVAWGALPGSPVRGWVVQLWRGDEADSGGVAAATAEAATAEGADASAGQMSSGISVLPVGGEARVVVREPSASLRLRVRAVSGVQVFVQWQGSGADPHFRTAPGRVEVVGGGAGEVLVEAPRGSRTLLELEGRLIAIVEGGRIRPLVEAESSSGDEVLISTPVVDR